MITPSEARKLRRDRTELGATLLAIVDLLAEPESHVTAGLSRLENIQFLAKLAVTRCKVDDDPACWDLCNQLLREGVIVRHPPDQP